jgi:hypothetical protein
MAHLRPCTECHRHVRGNETRCPFCDAELAAVAPAASAKPGTPLTRAAIIFGAAATVAACVSGGPDPGPTSSSSSGGSSSGTSGTSSSGAAPAYGVPEIDSGPDKDDSGGPVALYGPAPVQDGG